jgi:hypothetical protein
MSLVEEIRERAAWVTGRARHVHLDEDAVDAYAATLPAGSPPAPDLEGASLEERAAFSLTLNAINFGSGWFPTLRKREGMSGFRTVEAGVRANGPWSAGELAAMSPAAIAGALGQDPGHELMGRFAVHLGELGRRVRDEHGSSFLSLARSGGGSAVALVEHLATWDTWQDVSPYDGERVPLFKRAQIAAADLALAGIAPAGDLAALTLFADNLVPHVLRIDGVLRFAGDLVARIDAGELIAHDSPEEVEIRAVALHAVERLVAAHGATTATAVDNVLWHRGAAKRYKDHPRHRSRTTAY